MSFLKPYYFALAAIALAFTAHWSLNYFNANRTSLPYYGQQVGGEYPRLPDFEFINQDSQQVHRIDFENKVTVYNYFFTSCPTICPRMNRNVQRVYELYRNDANVRFVSLTVDPKRDNPSRLNRYAELYNADTPGWQFLTGDKKELYRFARNGLFISATEGSGDDNDFIHSENVVLTDGKGFIRGYYVGTDPASVNKLINDISNLLKNNKA